MVRLSSALLPDGSPRFKVVFLDNDYELDCAHVTAAWDVIRASGFKIPYMCSYGVQAGMATAALINGLEHYRQTRCTHVGLLDPT
jgi:hypothetical protein